MREREVVVGFRVRLGGEEGERESRAGKGITGIGKCGWQVFASLLRLYSFEL